MSAHTTGKWHYDDEERMVYANGRPIAEVITDDYNRRAADGHLMAAAEKLLGACRQANSVLEDVFAGEVKLNEVASAMARISHAISHSNGWKA